MSKLTSTTRSTTPKKKCQPNGTQDTLNGSTTGRKQHLVVEDSTVAWRSEEPKYTDEHYQKASNAKIKTKGCNVGTALFKYMIHTFHLLETLH